MKKNNLIYMIIPFLSILFFSSCDLLTNTPKEPSLPAITTVGAGTFGCGGIVNKQINHLCSFFCSITALKILVVATATPVFFTIVLNQKNFPYSG